VPKKPVSSSVSKRSFKGKIALVTGATQGIGLEIARALADEGCALILSARNQARLRTVETQLARKKVRVLAVPCDVRDEQSVTELFAAIRQQFGRLDILVNSAGIAHAFTPVGKLPLETWDDVLATNLTGTFVVTQAALRLMKRGATIANILSMSAKRAFPNLAAYNASKFGALGFTSTLRAELRSEGIRVIAVLPGATDTPIWDTLWPDAPREKMIHPATVARALVDALKLTPESTVEELDIMPTAGAL